MKSTKKPKLDVNNLKHIRVDVPVNFTVMEVVITSAKGQKTFRSNKGIDKYMKKILTSALPLDENHRLKLNSIK